MVNNICVPPNLADSAPPPSTSATRAPPSSKTTRVIAIRTAAARPRDLGEVGMATRALDLGRVAVGVDTLLARGTGALEARRRIRGKILFCLRRGGVGWEVKVP